MSEVPLYALTPRLQLSRTDGATLFKDSPPLVSYPPSCVCFSPCRGASLTRKRTPLGPYRRPIPRVLDGS